MKWKKDYWYIVGLFALLAVIALLATDTFSVFNGYNTINPCANDLSQSGKLQFGFNESVGVALSSVSLECGGTTRSDGYCNILVHYVDGTTYISPVFTAGYTQDVYSRTATFAIPSSKVVSSIDVFQGANSDDLNKYDCSSKTRNLEWVEYTAPVVTNPTNPAVTPVTTTPSNTNTNMNTNTNTNMNTNPIAPQKDNTPYTFIIILIVIIVIVGSIIIFYKPRK